jgi:hypothetical protein
MLVGIWKTPGWNYYHTLSFNPDSTAIFDNHIDTLYRYKYWIESDSLVLRSANGSQFRTSIINLTSDSLVLGGLEYRREILHYKKVTK